MIMLVVVLAAPAMAADPFTDLPADHWAFDAVKELSEKGYMDGYLDGTFKGRKVVTRYELALILARMLHKVESYEQEGGVVPAADEQLLGRLSQEFKGELASLGVRMDDVEKRIKVVEDKIAERPKLKVFGFYTAAQRFIEDSESTYDDPRKHEDKHWSLYHPWDQHQDTMDADDEQGFGPLYQNVFLKVLANPYENVETYLELNAWVYGRYFDRKYYPEWTDDQDPELFDLRSERGVQVQKAHFTLDNPTVNFRVFAGEKLTPLTNPTRLTTTKWWIYFPDFGMEMQGSLGNINYFGALYTEEKGSESEFVPDGYRNENYDTAAGRLTWTLPSNYTRESDLTLGGTFVEYMKDYHNAGNYNRLTCADISYRNRTFGDLSVSTEVLRSEDGIDGRGVLKDLGHKMDVSYNLGEFIHTLNYYNYGNRFRVRTIDKYDLFIDIWDNSNYGRGTGDILEQGEQFIRYTGKYDYDNKGDEKDFKVEGIVQQKAWEADPNDPKETDHYNGEMYSLQMWADLTKNSDARAYFRFRKDAFAEETGEGHAELELNGKAIRDTVNTRLETYMDRDGDSENLHGKSETGYGFVGEVTADVTEFIWSKLVIEHHVQRDGFTNLNMDASYLESAEDRFWNTELHVDEYHFENRFDLSDAVTFTGIMKGRWRNCTSYTDLDNSSHWVIGELDWAFTGRLKGKASGWWKKNKGWWDDTDYRGVFQNIYGELIYDATDTTKLKLVFGDTVDWNKDYREDAGYPSVETEKKVFFQAETEF